MRRMKFSLFLVVSCLSLASAARAQSPRTLYTWCGTGDLRKWSSDFGTNTVNLENATDGELTITETGADLDAGTAIAIRDDFDQVVELDQTGNCKQVLEGSDSQGGLDLTGLSALEFDLGHNGAAPVSVQATWPPPSSPPTPRSWRSELTLRPAP